MTAHKVQGAHYPQFAIVICGEQQFVTERQAAQMIADSPKVITCQLGALVRDVDGERGMTPEERKGVLDLAHELKTTEEETS